MVLHFSKFVMGTAIIENKKEGKKERGKEKEKEIIKEIIKLSNIITCVLIWCNWAKAKKIKN